MAIEEKWHTIFSRSPKIYKEIYGYSRDESFIVWFEYIKEYDLNMLKNSYSFEEFHSFSHKTKTRNVEKIAERMRK